MDLCRPIGRALTLAALWGVVPSPANAQTIGVVHPGPPTPLTQSAFGRIAAFREIEGERLLILDPTDRGLVLLIPGQRGFRTVGREGSGPGEYRWPSRLLALPGGETGVLDAALARILKVSAEGQAQRTIDPRGPSRSGGPIPSASFGDTLGFLYGAAALVVRGQGSRWAALDTLLILRWRSGEPRLDTVARAHRRLPPTASVYNGMVVSRPGPTVAYSVESTWTVGVDGWVAVVHPDPYRIELTSPDGHQITTAPIPTTPVRLTTGHRRLWREVQSLPVVQLVYPGQGRTPFTRVVRPKVREPDRWPAFLPTITGEPPIFDQQGRLWVARSTPAEAGPLFDVFDRKGDRQVQVMLPRGTRLLGFGRQWLYLARRNRDDLERVDRHPLPPGLAPP